jgi:hypothetical protein
MASLRPIGRHCGRRLAELNYSDGGTATTHQTSYRTAGQAQAPAGLPLRIGDEGADLLCDLHLIADEEVIG